MESSAHQTIETPPAAKKRLLLLCNIYFLYTFVFLCLLPFIFLPFLTNDKTLVWNVDGISQHYPILQYYGKLLRGFFSGQGFPLVDTNLGMGFDTITTLHYYVLGDPLALLSIFCTPENSIYMYGALILLRLYLIGISFIIFMRYWKRNGIRVILGALLYVFCGYSLFGGVRHPYFLNPMIYLPLIFIGLEQVLRRRKPYLLIIMAFISTLSNFYFAYILTIISIIYVVFRYFTVYRKNHKNIIGGLLKTGVLVGGYYLLGIAMSSFVFLPVIYSFLQCDRLTSNQHLLIGYLHYNIEYYGALLQSVFAPGTTPGYWVTLSFPSVTAFSFTIMLINKKFRHLRLAFILACFALFVPAFGYIMNGLSYITNRWSFFISFLVAIIFIMTYDYLFQLERAEIILIIVGIIGYAILSFLVPAKKQVKLEFFFFMVTSILILILQIDWFKQRRILQESVLCAIILLSLGRHGYTSYSPNFTDYVDEFLTKSQIDTMTDKGALSLVKEIDDSSFYRIETYGDIIRNEALIVGFNDVSGYFSMLDGNITNYFKELELLDQKNSYRFDSFDTRTILDALASVKYFITTKKSAVPYGYQFIKEKTDGFKHYYLYENVNALPLGYTYHTYLPKEEYDQLSSLEKQNAMMSTVILDENISNVKKTSQDMSAGLKKLDVTIATDKKVRIGKKYIKVKRKGGSIYLSFQSEPNSETYLRLGQFSFVKKAATMTSFKAIGEKEAKKYVNVRSIYHNTYFGKDDYLINTGYSDQAKTKITITFPAKENYRYESFDVYSLDMNYYEKHVQALMQSTLQNIKIAKNTIQGSISLDKNGVLVLSIPYSKGWNAYVDGEKANIYKANVMYMALALDKGDHTISLVYTTPYLKVGLVISFISLVVFIGIIIFYKFANNKEKL